MSKSPFLACFDIVCAYGLILSTCGVLTPFSSFLSNILGFGQWRLIWDDLKNAWIFSIIQVGRSSVFEGHANILLMKFFWFSKTFMLIPLSLCTTFISLCVTSLHWCRSMPKLLWSFRWYKMRQSMRLSFYIIYTYVQ